MWGSFVTNYNAVSVPNETTVSQEISNINLVGISTIKLGQDRMFGCLKGRNEKDATSTYITVEGLPHYFCVGYSGSIVSIRRNKETVEVDYFHDLFSRDANLRIVSAPNKTFVSQEGAEISSFEGEIGAHMKKLLPHHTIDSEDGECLRDPVSFDPGAMPHEPSAFDGGVKFTRIDHEVCDIFHDFFPNRYRGAAL